ncbi:ATP-binding protein [Bacteriovorax sp. PP10]|uniref:ATP-binding protein n=1 Tax=Bacteriovorax antarcticus TaxID=3088717 RepID=A0ABU5W2Z4_9BACT|nr:ATP-binding protein [Bacteriovorax sp. PP10]MEA9358610.1 ATP-binding protein [Bacteriovorax sp. PP10]
MKTLINLDFTTKLSESLALKNGLLQVIIGPRQVGKTTTVLKYLEENHPDKFLFYSADEVFNATSNWILEIWSKARSEKKILVIDEIQKCENWSAVIKKLWDEDKRNKKEFPCILLGSSSLEIQKGLTESLTGRFQLHKAYHWNHEESEKGYGLSFEDYLKFGGYPGSYNFKDKDDWAKYVKQSIILTVIEKDILQYHAVKSPALFKQAFEIIMSYPAQEISYTKLLGQLQDKGNTELIKYYLSLYEGAFLVKVLEKYSAKKIITKSSTPKILPLAPCLYYLEILDEYKKEELGRVFELVVGAQLVRTDESLYYWREGSDEVDFVLKKGRKLYGIEVKSGRKKSQKGLEKFKAKFPEAKLIMITFDNYKEFEKNPMQFLENC